jgi:hypothetical protein
VLRLSDHVEVGQAFSGAYRVGSTISKPKGSVRDQHNGPCVRPSVRLNVYTAVRAECACVWWVA